MPSTTLWLGEAVAPDTKAKAADTSPAMIWKWTAWEDERRRIVSLPPHAYVISRGAEAKERHYALVCYSESSISLGRGGRPLDPNLCRTPSGKLPGAPQVTALLYGSPEAHKGVLTKWHLKPR